MKSYIRTGLALGFATVIAGIAAAQSTSRASLATNGAQGNGTSDFSARGQALSGDGRFVAFASWATNLVAGDSNGHMDVFLRDRLGWTTTRVNVSSSGAQADKDYAEWGLSISGDGRYVAFGSLATNLVAGDTNGVEDIFVHDNQTGTTTRVSVDSSGAQANSHSREPSLSLDGRFVAFTSWASNLHPGDANGLPDIFVHDMQTGQTVLVSLNSLGAHANGASSAAALSGDGRFVAFCSYADNLGFRDTNGLQDVFLHDCQTGETARLNLGAGGVQADNQSYAPRISADGRHVVFHSMATNLVPGDTNGFMDVFLCDTWSGLLTRIDVGPSLVQADADSTYADISADGRWVVYHSLADNLVPADTNSKWDVFLYDAQFGNTTRTSTSYVGTNANGASHYPAISADGQRIAYGSLATNLVTDDTNGFADVFVRDLGQPGVAFCFGDGSLVSCPCFNDGAAGRGCNNSSNTGGAQLESWGAPLLGYDTLLLSSWGELPTAATMFLQGDAAIDPVSFGNGLLCTSGALKRMYVKNAAGGSVNVPQPGDPSVSARSAALGDTLGVGATRFYQAYYRDPRIVQCLWPLGGTWNTSNALSVTWLP